MSDALIIAATVAAAHEGKAELILDIGYANGGVTQVPLDHFASQALFQACAASTVDDLIGQRWEKVRDALQSASSRF